MSRAASTDPLVRVRTFAATGMFMAGLCGIAGALLDWITLDPPPVVPEDQAARAVPFNGIDAGDGIVVIILALIMMFGAGALISRRRTGPVVLAVLAAVVIGGIAFADFRAVEDRDSGLLRRMEPIGTVGPGIGLTLTAASAILGLMTGLLAIAATPKLDEERIRNGA